MSNDQGGSAMSVVHLVTWPPNSRVSFYNGRGERLWQASAYRYDLAENLMFGWDTRRPRILFLADRNILAGQAYNAFSAFPDDALVRIKPDEIRKKGKVPTNGSIFFTIFQTFMCGPNDSEYFGEYPKDFFDFIVIDECHRGGAKDESSWRGILDYFEPAVKLGLTATPKRTDNVDTYPLIGSEAPTPTAASSASGVPLRSSFSGSTPSPTSRTSTRPSRNSAISTTTSGSSNDTTTGLPHWSVRTSLAPGPPREYTQPSVQEIPGGSPTRNLKER